MDFTIPPGLAALKERTREFILGQVIPYEKDPRQTPHGPSDELRRELNGLAAKAGLLTPHASRELGGLELAHVEKAIVFEETWPNCDAYRRAG